MSQVSFRCLKLQGQKEEQVPYQYTGSNSTLNIIILNVQNDDRVLSVIKDRYIHLDKNYDVIIGLRDMYFDGYPDTKVNETENKRIIKNIKKEINKFDNHNKIRFFFMIMEFESWLFNLRTTLEEYIFEEFDDIPNLPTESEKIFRPSNLLKSILGNYKISYQKHFSQTESILSHLKNDDLKNVLNEKRVSSFRLFLRYCSRGLQL
jgi:hypothetical protein